MNDHTKNHAGSSPGGRPGPRRAGLLATAAAGLALLAAACGGGSTAAAPPAAASPAAAASAAATQQAATPPTAAAPATAYQQALAYAACMRAHGIPAYPAPDPRTVEAGATGPGYYTAQALHTTMSRLRAAAQACRALVPDASRSS